jgi:anaerobic ribonucleoside-triphosphate reductase
METSSICPKCGKEKVPCCSVPGCTAHVDVYSRVVGYLRPISTWNPGKQQEFLERHEYDIRNGGHDASED